jgi:SAM-dependent methyltransferase
MKPFDDRAMRRHWESEATNYTLERKRSAVDDKILQLLQPKKGDRLLEIGFGSFVTGEEIINAFPDCVYFGVDLADKFLDFVRNKGDYRVFLIKATASDLPFAADSLDLILELDAIHHFPKNRLPEIVLEVSSLLKPKGKFILAEDWAAAPDNEKARLAHAIQARRYLTSHGFEYHPTESEWLGMFTAANLKVVHQERVDRPLNLGRFEELTDLKSIVELKDLRKLWGSEKPTTKMTIFICEKD